MKLRASATCLAAVVPWLLACGDGGTSIVTPPPTMNDNSNTGGGESTDPSTGGSSVDNPPPDGSGGTGGTPVVTPPETDFSRPVGKAPNKSYPQDAINTIISPVTTEGGKPYGIGTSRTSLCKVNCGGIHDQPSFINGYLMICGEGDFSLWDILDPTMPKLISEFESGYSIYKNGGGEAESHQVAFSKQGTNLYVATISGRGITFFDITDPTAPELLKDLILPGINFGDVTAAVWGVTWQGDYVYVGGTDQGVFVVNASDPANPTIAKQLRTGDYGGFSAGPIFALGNLLIVTPPKNKSGIATLDIADPANPQRLASNTSMPTTYLGGFFDKYVWFMEPIRAWDVTTNPLMIQQVGPNLGCGSKAGCNVPTPDAEYMSFADDVMFMGHVRATSGSGITKFDLTDISSVKNIGRITGRTIGSPNVVDDQFALGIGNLVVLSDDEEENAIGSIIKVHSTDPDNKPPLVHYINPPDGATGLPLSTRIGLAFSDQIELVTVNDASLIVRAVGGEQIRGTWNHVSTTVNFTPDEPLKAGTEYEVILAAGGITDLVGNGIAEQFRSTFKTQ